MKLEVARRLNGSQCHVQGSFDTLPDVMTTVDAWPGDIICGRVFTLKKTSTDTWVCLDNNLEYDNQLNRVS